MNVRNYDISANYFSAFESAMSKKAREKAAKSVRKGVGRRSKTKKRRVKGW